MEYLGHDNSGIKVLYSSRLLNLQIKSIVLNTCEKLIAVILMDLEKVMRKRQRKLWPICFTSILLLSFVMEQAQNLVYTHIQVAGSSGPSSMAGHQNELHESCGVLEEAVYGQLTYIFHALYRTSKDENGGLNPFGDHFTAANEPGFDDAAMNMIDEIKEKALDHSMRHPSKSVAMY